MEVMADAEAVMLLEDVCVFLCTRVLIFGRKEIVVGDQREREGKKQ